MKRLHIASVFLIVFTCFPAWGQNEVPWARAQAHDVAYPAYGLEVGSGWNSFLNQKMPATCVDFMEINIPTGAYSIDYDFVQDTYSFAKSQSHSASGKFKGFGFKASVSAAGTSETRVNRDYLSALFQAEFNFGSTQAVPPQRLLPTVAYGTASEDLKSASRFGRAIRLTPEARQLIQDGKVGRFLQTCGDAFVLAVHRGVRVNVLVTYNGTAQSDKQSFSADVSAKGFGGAIKYAGSGSQEENATTKGATFEVRQEGGLEPIIVATDIDDSFSFEQSLDVSKMLEGPSSFSATVLPYANLIDFAGKEDMTLMLTRFDRLEEQRALFYFLSDLETILAEVDLATILGTRDDAQLYSPLHVRALSAERQVARTRFQVFRLLRILGSSIDNCYRLATPCDTRVIKVPQLETQLVQAHLDRSVAWLETERVSVLNEIKDAVQALDAFLNFTQQNQKDALYADLWKGASSEEILEDYASNFQLGFENEAARQVFETIKSNNPSFSLLRSEAGVPRLSVELPSVWSPGANGVDTSSLSGFFTQSEMETDIREELNNDLKLLQAALDTARENLRAFRAEAEVILADFETYFTPLIDVKKIPDGKCRVDEYELVDPAQFGLAPDLSEDDDLAALSQMAEALKAAKPCDEISIERWIAVLYNLAAATPLTTDQLDIDGLTSQESKWGTANDNADAKKLAERRVLLTNHIHDKIFAERLYPFRESLCQASIAEAYCIDNDKLRSVSLRVKLALEDDWLKAPKAVTAVRVTKPRRSPVIRADCSTNDRDGRRIYKACP